MLTTKKQGGGSIMLLGFFSSVDKKKLVGINITEGNTGKRAETKNARNWSLGPLNKDTI